MSNSSSVLVSPGIASGRPRRVAIVVVAGGFWALSVATLVVSIPSSFVRFFVAAAMVLTLPDISKPLRLPLLVCVLMLGVLTLQTGDVAPLAAGLDFAAPLAGFLVSIGVLRAALTSGTAGVVAGGRFDALPPANRRSAVMLLSFALSTVFLVGVFPLLAPLLATRDRAENQKLAAAALCGGALAFLWSPFGVGMAFATATIGIAAGWSVTVLMFAVAAGGLAIGLTIHGRLSVVVLRQTAHAVRPLLAPLGLAVATILAATSVLSLRVTQVVPVVSPLIIVVLALRTGPRQMLSAGPARDAVAALPTLGAALKDLTVFAVGFALARALTESGIFAAVTHTGLTLPIGTCVPAALVTVTLVLGLLGVPSIVCAGLVAASSAVLMAGSPLSVQLVLTLYAWASASMLSVTSGTLTVVASSFGVALRPLVLGPQLALHRGLRCARGHARQRLFLSRPEGPNHAHYPCYRRPQRTGRRPGPGLHRDGGFGCSQGTLRVYLCIRQT